MEIKPKVIKPFQAEDAMGFQTSRAIYPYTEISAPSQSGDACSSQ
jgi:hypothetical protein